MSPPTTMLLRPTFTFTPPAALALALVLSSAAAAQTTTFHDAAGRVTGKATTRNGATTFYDSAGRVTGKARTNAEGTTTFYDAASAYEARARAKQPVGDDAEANPAVHSVEAFVAAAIETVSPLDHADAPLASGPPFLPIGEPALLLLAFALAALSSLGPS